MFYNRGIDTCETCLDKRLGDAIKARRKELGLSQETLGFGSGRHRNYVSDIERGLKSLSLRVMVKLADALGVSVSTLVRMAEKVPASSLDPGNDAG